MKATMCAVVAAALAGSVMAPVTGSATAESRYDRKLEEAAMSIVAARMGDIRGGFAFDAKPAMVVVQGDTVRAAPVEDAARIATSERLPEGLQRAVESPVGSDTIF